MEVVQQGRKVALLVLEEERKVVPVQAAVAVVLAAVAAVEAAKAELENKFIHSLVLFWVEIYNNCNTIRIKKETSVGK